MWIQKLQEYDFDIRHRKGSLHGNADALSRKPCLEGCRYCATAEEKYQNARPIVRQIKDSTPLQPDLWSDKEVRQSQMNDPDLKPIIEFLESSGSRPTWQDISSFSPGTKRYWALWDSLHIRDGVLYRN